MLSTNGFIVDNSKDSLFQEIDEYLMRTWGMIQLGTLELEDANQELDRLNLLRRDLIRWETKNRRGLESHELNARLIQLGNTLDKLHWEYMERDVKWENED